MNTVKELKANLIKTYETNLRDIDKNIPLYDVATKLGAYWTELTGERVTPSFYSTGPVLSLHMSHLMASGRYPTKQHHVSLMVEKADELLAGIVDFDDFYSSQDDYSQDMVWGTGNGNMKLYFHHGGVCKRVKVGTETVEKDIYEVECN